MKKEFNIAVLPGDGVGPEIIKEAVKVLQKISEKYSLDFIFSYADFGAVAIEKHGTPLPEETLNICKNSDAILFGAIGDPKYDNDPKALIRPEQGLLKLRKELGLFINLRPIKIFPQLLDSSPIKNERIINADFTVVRELTGGIYFGTPRARTENGTRAIDTAIYTKKEIERVAIFAFELSRSRRKKLTSVDKANVLETSRLWRETVNEISEKYPDVALNHMFVDNCAMQIIKRPSEFDVILTENMFGDILTDEASVITGSIGLLPSASIGKNHSLFEPIHGSFYKAKGLNIANPIGTILSAALMLRISFNMEKDAAAIEKVVNDFLEKGYRTKDIADKNMAAKNILGTKETGDKICSFI